MQEKHRHSSTPCRSKLKTLRSPWRLARLFGLLPLLTLTACQTTTGSEGISSQATFCSTARAILWSKRDTLGTIEQVKAHNAVGAALRCGWKGAKQK